MEATKRAFTLAEVLTTLTIIGVIASMTIPGLLQSIQEAELKTKWKRVYGELSQAVLQVRADNGGTMLGLCLSASSKNECLRDYLATKLSVVKTCNATLAYGNCWHSLGSFYYYNGSTISTTTVFGNPPGLILNNGSFLVMYLNDTSCTNPIGSLLRCGWMAIDLNGIKSPNVIGKDIFQINITEYKLRPSGSGDGYENTCVTSSSGIGCSAQYLYK